MMPISVIYDDTSPKSEIIADIIGSTGFAHVVVQRQTLMDRFCQLIRQDYPDAGCTAVSSEYEFSGLFQELERHCPPDTRILHFFSNYVVVEPEKFLLTLKKLPFIEEPYCLTFQNQIPGILFPDLSGYQAFLEQVGKCPSPASRSAARSIPEQTPVEGLMDIGKIENFIQCITGNLDARYFNSLRGDAYTLVKSSTNKEKLRAEYRFYHLLPEDMRFWFVEPFDFQETETQASYTMERLHMTDLAIKWVHGSVDEAELNSILDKYLYFFTHRHSRPVSQAQYQATADKLYVDKVRSRIAELKALPMYADIHKLLTLNGGTDLDSLAQQYFRLKERIEARVKPPFVSVIGHGDPCFANTMYNKSTRTLKFIDPRGALEEKDLWTDAYYDLAKLSHSICGNYDFFNNGLYEITLGPDFHTELTIAFDNTPYKKLFRQKVEDAGYDYWLIRIYEASLFLSMLPLHRDNPRKVYGFILNAQTILKEIEEHV